MIPRLRPQCYSQVAESCYFTTENDEVLMFRHKVRALLLSASTLALGSCARDLALSEAPLPPPPPPPIPSQPAPPPAPGPAYVSSSLHVSGSNVTRYYALTRDEFYNLGDNDVQRIQRLRQADGDYGPYPLGFSQFTVDEYYWFFPVCNGSISLTNAIPFYFHPNMNREVELSCR